MTKWKYVCFERTIIRSRGAETVGQKPAVKRLSGKKGGLSSWQCRRQIACLAFTECWFGEMGHINLARTVSRNTSFYFKLPLVFHHLRESDVGFKTTPIILEKAVRENKDDLPAALHASDNILNRCNADLGKSSHLFRFNKLQPTWKGWMVHIQLFHDVSNCKSFRPPESPFL